MTKARARILAGLLSDAARSLLRKKYMGEAHVAPSSVWQELRSMELIVWDADSQTALFTTRGKHVAHAIAAENA